MQQIIWTELMQRFLRSDRSPDAQLLADQVRSLALQPETESLVLFANVDPRSSQFGAQTILTVGPTRTYQTLEQIENHWLHDLPSQRQYPQAWVDCTDKNSITEVAL